MLKLTEERVKLERLVEEAKVLLSISEESDDKRAYEMLKDMTSKAEAALAGKRFPFTCSREFWKSNENDEINFYLRHSSMVSSFYVSDEKHTTFGLEDAVEWFKNREKYTSPDPANVRLELKDINEGNFFLTDTEMEDIRSKIKNDEVFAKQYQNIKDIADQATLEQRKEWYEMNRNGGDYSELRKQVDLWRKCGYGANFTIPADAKKIVVSINLPSKENMQDGLGYIWIRDMYLKSSNGNIVYVDFEENQELYLKNKTIEDNALWESQSLDVLGGMVYTMFFEAKQEGKFKEGVNITVVSYDENDNEVGRYTYCYNKKSWIQVLYYNLSMQCDAIVYMVTGDKTYAEKAKIEMLHGLDDMCQGAYYWMTYRERPEGSDSYGAVQAGRNLCSIAVTYAMIEKADVFNPEEKALLYELLDFMLGYVLDLRDRTRMSFDRAQHRSGNWQTDMCIGASMIMFAFKDLPYRENWIDNAYTIVYGQMNANLNKDGSWPESIRYHHAVLNRLMAYARVLKRNVGVDWFRDTDLLKMFEYGVDIQTPAYEYFDNCISTPPFGDHKLSAGDEFSTYGQYLNEVMEIDPELADKMYLTWDAAGRRMHRLWGESITVENFLYPSSYEPKTVRKLQLQSTNKYTDAGIYIFRNAHDNGKMDYLAVMSSKKRIGHGHFDQGSFILFKENVPVVMDTGIEGYFNSSTPWHKSSYSHACMLFAAEKVKQENFEGFINLSVGNFTREKGFWDTALFSKVLSNDMGGDKETIQIEIHHVSENGKQIRTIEVDKIARTWTIRDEVVDYEGEVMFILPLMASSLEITDNEIHMEGYYGVELNVSVKSKYRKIEVEKGKTMPVYPTTDEVQYLDYVRIYADAKDGFEVIIQ